MTGAAYRQGFINAMLCAVVALVSWYLARWLVSSITNWTAVVAGWTAFGILFGSAMLMFFIGLLQGLQRRGVMLLDCGPHPSRRLFLLNAALFTFTGAISSFSTGLWSMAFALMFAAYWVVMSTGRLTLHESGIWVYWSLIRWDMIDSYEWKNQRTLRFRRKGRISGLSHGALPVPEDCVSEFDRLLTEHAGQATKQ